MSRNLYSKYVTRADKMAAHSVVLGAIARDTTFKNIVVVVGYSRNAKNRCPS